MKPITLPAFFREHAEIIESFEAADVTRYLTNAEHDRVAPFRSEKRRREWIASRIALRRLAISRGIITEPLDLLIQSDARPPIASAEAQRLYVSFSHSANAGAAAMSERRVGVDLEQVREVEPRLTRFFLSAEESRRTDELTLPAKLIHLWAAKEAAFKLVATLTLLREVELDAWSSDGAGLDIHFRGGELSGTIRTAQLDDRFILALAHEL